jgi:hypothetical protein
MLIGQEYFDYFNKSINAVKTDNVQEVISRFVTGIIRPDFRELSSIEKLYFKLINDTFDISEKEQLDLLQNKDRYVPSEVRKAGGEYFTPETLAQYGREIVGQYIDLKDCHVWDVSCGTGNLLRSAKDLNPSKVYLSTLNKSDIDLIRNTEFYSDEVTMFNCDFLCSIDYDSVNTGFLDTLPDKLQKAVKNNEKILFFFNPPFKSFAPETTTSLWMKELGLGKATGDLYTQFIFKVVDFIRVHNLTNSVMGVYSPATYLKDNTGLLSYIQKYMDFQEGIVFNSNEFADTTSSEFWGIVFVAYTHKQLEVNKIGDGCIKRIGLDSKGNVREVSKMELGLFKTKERRISEWAKSKEADYYVQMPAYKFFNSKPVKILKASVNSFAYTSFVDTLAKNGKAIISTRPITFEGYIDITKENLERAITMFAAHRSITDRGDFGLNMSTPIEPEREVEEELLRDFLIFSLFDLKSYQFSARVDTGNVENVRNTMFYMDTNRILKAAEDQGLDLLTTDYGKYGHKNVFYDKYVKNAILKGVSPEAQELYDYCCKANIDTLKYRTKMPENYHMNCWDAGWVQIRYMLKELKLEEIERGYFERLIEFKKKLANDVINLGVYSHAN